jgi:hypothetical protein
MSADDAGALLQRVTEDRDRRCAMLRAAADAQAQQIVRSAHTEARQNVSQAVIQERTRMELGMRQATARADIEARRRERLQSRELIGQMWARITDVLERRWQEPDTRRAWIDAALTQATSVLAGRPWFIEGGPDWTEEQRAELILRAGARGARSVQWSRQAAMTAGFRIRSGNVCIDATVPGLLAQRDAIEAALLAEYLPVKERQNV